MGLALGVISFGLLPCAVRGGSARWSWQLYACAPGLRQTNGDGLLRAPGSMLSFPDMMHLLAHKLTGLCRGRLAFPFIFPGTFESVLFGHICLCRPERRSAQWVVNPS